MPDATKGDNPAPMAKPVKVERRAAIGPLWHTAAALLVMLAPSQLYLGIPFWRLGPDRIVQCIVLGAAYLALALCLRTQGGERFRPLWAIAASALCFGIGYLFLVTLPGINYSRVLVFISVALGTMLAVVPSIRRRLHLHALLTLAVTSAVFIGFGIGSPMGIPQAGPMDHVLTSAIKRVSVTYQRNLIAPATSDGGGLVRYGDGFLLATGSGEIYRLEWEPRKNALKSVRIPIGPPMDRKAFLAERPVTEKPLRLRVTDIALDDRVVPATIYLAHQNWNGEDKCFTFRVSSAPIPPDLTDAPSEAKASTQGWKNIYESSTCLSAGRPFDDSESGGRLAWNSDGRLLLTMGDFGLIGLVGPAAVAQDSTSDFGKVLLLDLAGGHEIFTSGHRNPQGLFVDRSGRIWETEHGPQGGDELNLLRPGKNYGWPLLTYGTDYGLAYWPISKVDNTAAYEDPVHAFVPSIAISNLIELGDQPTFAEWKGDLLVGSLRMQSLYRMRLVGDRVAYVEPMEIGRRIRDIKQAADGRIVLWTDEGDIVVLASAPRESVGESLFGQCTRCHEPGGAGTTALAPNLHRSVGRPVAAEAGFAYSAGLASLGGSWTVDRLDAFLRNPAAYVPGNTMQYAGMPDDAERKALIAYLKAYR